MSDINSIEGIVTFVNSKFLYFEINDCELVVNIGFHVADEPLMPKIGQPFSSENIAIYEKMIEDKSIHILSQDCIVRSELHSTEEGIQYWQLIEEHSLNIEDVFEIVSACEKIRSSCNFEHYSILFKYIKDCLENGNLEKTIRISSLSDISLINVMESYPDLPKWSFGTRWRQKGEILVGSFSAQEIQEQNSTAGNLCTGRIVFTEANGDRKIIAILINPGGNNLCSILNRNVYVVNFCVVSEIFNPIFKYHLQYLLVDFHDIKLAENSPVNVHSLQRKTYSHKLTCKILSKSNVTYDAVRKMHFWLELNRISGTYDVKSTFFLSVPGKFNEIYVGLMINHTLELNFNELRSLNDPEISRVNSKVPQYCLFADSYLRQLEGKSENGVKPIPSTFSELDKLRDRNNLISFQTKLIDRKFCEPNTSRTSDSEAPIFCGTIGSDLHILSLALSESNVVKLYMGNWERMIPPFGLIPGIKMNVYNVRPAKSYLQSTALTNFEIIGFETDFKYSTAKLDSEHKWGNPFPLSWIEKVSNKQIYYGIFNEFKVSFLEIHNTCKNHENKTCKSDENNLENNCNFEVSVKLVLRVRDCFGEAEILIKKSELLRILLTFNKKEWIAWKHSFCENVGNYVLDRRNRGNLFSSLTSELIETIERIANLKFGIKCRKVATDEFPCIWEAINLKIMNLPQKCLPV